MSSRPRLTTTRSSARRMSASRASDGKLYIDLCDKMWRAIEIDADGWRIVDAPPVRFRRASGALELPVPVSGGSIDDLRPFLNVRNARDFILIVAWTLAALIDSGPLSGARFYWRAGCRQVDCFENFAHAYRPQHRAIARPAAERSRALHQRHQRAFACLRQCDQACSRGYRTRCAGCRAAAVSRSARFIPTTKRCCLTRRGRSSLMASATSSLDRISPLAPCS